MEWELNVFVEGREERQEGVEEEGRRERSQVSPPPGVAAPVL